MNGPDRAALVALLRQARRPWPVYSEQLEEGEKPLEILERELAETDAGQTSLIGGDSGTLLEAAAADLETWKREGFALVTVLDADYPINLRAVHDRPPILFVAGELMDTDGRSLAVVGSRRASAAGLERAGALSRHLAQEDCTVVSGLASGIDTAAHRAALAAAGRTVAVIGTGLRHSYPPENAELQRELVKGAAVVSQFWPDAPPSRHSFPLRNGVMSGLTLGTAIVEASVTSGARTQARLALAHGRPVFLARELMRQAWAQQLAERPGVHLYAEPAEVTTVLARVTETGVPTA
ncbi:MAG: DNA-processing protein DprA [Solirubrobacteraceae bacterium]